MEKFCILWIFSPSLSRHRFRLFPAATGFWIDTLFHSRKRHRRFGYERQRHITLKDAPRICSYTAIISRANNERVVFGDGRRISKDSTAFSNHDERSVSLEWHIRLHCIYIFIVHYYWFLVILFLRVLVKYINWEKRLLQW